MKTKEMKNKLSVKCKKMLARMSPSLTSKIIYKKVTKKKLNLKEPKLFNEKLMYLKLNDYYKNELISNCADKYKVREYVKSCGCEEILNDLYGVYNEASEINWNELPNKFVLKCNHGCGFNIICDDKEKLNYEESSKKLEQWMKEKFGYETVEIHYTQIKPKIICEKYLETSAGFLPNDYKIYCFNGVPKIILVCTERSTGTKLTFFDLNWKIMDIVVEKYKTNNIPQKPENLQEMIEYATKLSRPFKFVRVDFYNYEGKVVFGELTFTPAGCHALYYNEKGNKLLGDMLEI